MRHVLLAMTGALVFAAYLHGSARSTEVIDWGFEAGGSGWSASGATFDTSAPPQAGTSGGRLVALSSGPVTLRSSYWLFPTVPGARLAGTLWVSGAAIEVSSIWAELEVVGAGGGVIDSEHVTGVPTGAYSQLTFAPRVAVADSAFVRVAVFAQPLRAGAELHLDSVVVTEVRPEITSTATSTATATGTTGTGTATATGTATGTSTATATSTTTATSTATGTSTVTATATRSPTAAPTPAAFGALTNGDFEDARGLYGWTGQGGTADAGSAFISASRAALLTSNSVSTKWIYQTVEVTSGAWYAATARLGALSTDDEVWLRLAWYASADGSGSQLDVVDSPTAPAGGGPVALGPARAPSDARSVRARLMLRPASAALTMLAADDVTLASVPAPQPTPSVSPTATSSATVAPSASAVSTSAARTPVPALRAGGGTSGGTAAGVGTAVTAAARTEVRGGSPRTSETSGAILRITELLPDPVQEGVDSDYEWVELANFGAMPANLEGFVLRDNAAALALPAMVLDPGGVLVVAAPRADTGAAVLVHLLEGALGNGLGNGGDRLALLTAGGAVLDAVSWGSDRTYLEGLSEVPAPGPGRSLLRLFTDDGSLVAVERLDVPTPGRADDSLVRVGEVVDPPHEAAVGGMGARGWMALLAIAAVALAWTLVLRAREAQRSPA